MKAHWLSRQYFGGIVAGIGLGIIVTQTLINPIWAPLEHKPADGTPHAPGPDGPKRRCKQGRRASPSRRNLSAALLA